MFVEDVKAVLFTCKHGNIMTIKYMKIQNLHSVVTPNMLKEKKNVNIHVSLVDMYNKVIKIILFF